MLNPNLETVFNLHRFTAICDLIKLAHFFISEKKLVPTICAQGMLWPEKLKSYILTFLPLIELILD